MDSNKFLKYIALPGLIIVVIILGFFMMKQYQLNIELNQKLTQAAADYDELKGSFDEMEDTASALLAQVEEYREKEQAAIDAKTPHLDLYPDLYIGEIPTQTKAEKTVYLTFDDGPSSLTLQVLDVLKEKDVKATFFVVGTNLESKKGEAILKRISDEGHSIGVHSYSHVYSRIYSSVESYLADFDKVFNKIYDITGQKPEIFRFPGGSINGHNIGIHRELISEMLRRGFVYYDWNASSRDSDTKVTSDQVFNSVVGGVKSVTRSIVLMHDTSSKTETLKALPAIIDNLENSGYKFDTITREVWPIVYVYRNS